MAGLCAVGLGVQQGFPAIRLPFTLAARLAERRHHTNRSRIDHVHDSVGWSGRRGGYILKRSVAAVPAGPSQSIRRSGVVYELRAIARGG
jgi:hypothetical protein